MQKSLETLGRREQRKTERRQLIIDTARVSFLERGYAATSMSGLLDTLGGSKSTLWQYFRSKEELFAAVIDDMTAEFRADIVAVLRPDQGFGRTLEAFCSGLIEIMDSPDGFAAWRLIASENVRFPELGRIFYERAVRGLEEPVFTLLEQAVAQGLLVPRPIPEMAMVLLNLCAGRQQRRVWGQQSAADPIVDARIFVEVFLRAFGACVSSREERFQSQAPDE